MLNKVFKTILIISICLGVTLPANAGSVSVSDGSAFITKSELSYELNALSNRMAQLENSLDSKIDSLVSSYLTRNGIWNGQEQTCLVTKNSYYTSTGVLSKTFVKTNKTGLLYTILISNYKHALQCFGTGSDPYTASVVNGNANIDIKIFSSSTSNSVWNNTKVVTWAGQWDIQADKSSTGIDYRCADTKDIDYVDTCLFFVNKDDEYRIEVNLVQNTQVHWNDGSDRRTGLDWAANGPGAGSRTQWNGTYNEGSQKYWGLGSYYKYQIGIGDVITVY